MKNRNAIVTVWHLVILLGIFVQVNAQDLSTDTVRVKLERFGIKDGLSQSLVNTMVQDREGYLWLGTKDGLNRYDGSTFKWFRHDPSTPASIGGNHVSDLVTDSSGLWAVIVNEGINRYIHREGNFRKIAMGDGLRSYDIVEIQHIADDQIAVIYQNSLPQIIAQKASQHDGEVSFDVHSLGEAFPKMADFLSKNPIANPGNNVWFTIGNKAIARIDNKLVFFDLKGEGAVNEHSFPQIDLMNARCIPNYDNSRLYIISAEGSIFEVDEDTGKPRLWKDLSGEFETAKHVFFDTNNNFWWRSSAKVFKQYIRDKDMVITMKTDRPFASDLDIVDDKQGVLWLRSGAHCLGKIDRSTQRFKTYAWEDISYRINGYLCEEADGRFYFAKDTSRAVKVHMMMYQKYFNAGDTLIEYGAKREWAIDSLPFREVMMEGHDPSYESHYLSAFEDSDRDLCTIGKSVSDSHELSYFDKALGTKVTVPFPKVKGPDPYPFLSDFIVDENDIWLATTRGIFLFEKDRNQWTHFDSNEKDGLPNRVVFSILKDPIEPKKYLWTGTEGGGLCKINLEDKSTTIFSEQTGLPNNVVYGLLSDDDKNIWLTTNRGLAKFDTQTELFQTFTSKDGINGNEFNRYEFAKHPDGRMFFGGIDGVTSFHPDEFKDKGPPSPLKIQGVKIFNEEIEFSADKYDLLKAPIEYADELTLSHDMSMVGLVYSLIDMRNAENCVYRYRLKGFDENWINAESSKEATYTNLDAGQYTFEVLGKNSQGNWSEEPIKLRIKVLPPWWATWWFRALIVFAISGVIYAAYRYRLNQLLQVERMRNQIAQDLHDEIGSTLSSISLYSAVMKSNEAELSPESKPILDRIITNVSGIMEKMNDMVWTIKSDNDSMGQVINRMRAFAAEMTEAKGIQLIFDPQPNVQEIKLGMDKRKEIYLIFKEAVNNAVKYSGGKRLTVDLKLNAGELEMSVRDNGNGFDTDNPIMIGSGGNGIAGMKKRAARIQAELDISSAPELGTTVKLCVKTNH